MSVPLVDLKAQYHSLRREIDQAFSRVIEKGEFILGPEVDAFEQESASYLGVRCAVGVASGTEALQLALLACGIGPGDEVITTPFTFIATVEAILQCHATPVFVDIDPTTCNIDTAGIERRITGRTRAILPVHLYGQPADMQPVMELAGKYHLKVIEDCAQALGAEYKGRKAGSLGDAGCFSFFPSKVLGAYGDGGLVTANDPEIAGKVEMLRNHGCREKYYHLIPGFNSRLDALQAAILMVKLRHVDKWIEARQRNAGLYSQLLGGLDGLALPVVAPQGSHVFNYYTLRVTGPEKARDRMAQHLKASGIATAVYYPLSLHLQEVCKPLGYKAGDFPQSECAEREVLSLPMYAELTEGQIEEVAGAIRAHCG